MNYRNQRNRSRQNSINFIGGAEKWRHFSRHTSRRDVEFLEENSDDEDSRSNNISNWEEEFFGRKNIDAIKSDQDLEVTLTKKQTLILSTLLPDEILLTEKFSCADHKRFVGVLLMADVSGYTALSERYSNAGKSGTYRLTVTLNTYLGSLIELIYTHGGDVVKFAGDAFLALWKTDKRSFISHTIHTVIACALIIQHSFGTYETDVKVNLKVKLAISAGNLIFAPIGTGIDMNYVIFGLPVVEAKQVESLCTSGEVKLSASAWGHCYSRNYDYVVHDDGHVTIKAILYDPHEKDVTKPFPGIGALIGQVKKPFNAIENLPDSIWNSSENLGAIEILKKNETLHLRRCILIAVERNIGSEIRKFMIRPVLTQIDAHQPLEYLTEMRQVSVLFITLKPRDCPFLQLITIVNNSYQITCEIVYKSMGCVNKIILFDKDVMILVIFGLRGFKHESEAQAALKCAYSIRKSVTALDGVKEVSIGITTGQAYCGVVGHPLRREFTVIGAVVNKAARLMCSFRNKIACDEATFIQSKMSANAFTLQPETILKGINHPGKIYEYTEDIRNKELFDIPMIPPLLNRNNEMEYFENWLDDFHKTFRDFDALLIVGESRIGKSKLIEWMARHARNNHYVCFLTLTSIHSATPYLALSQIINKILDIEEPVTGFVKEEKIVQLLKVYHEDLCYLNNIIKVRFAYHEAIYGQDEQMRMEKAKRIFKILISCIFETHVILLDDLQNLDQLSWEFILLMMESKRIFTVFTVTRGKFSSIHNWLYSVFINSNIRKIMLGPLSSSWIAPLACQILNVDAVSNDLCIALKSKCKGMPGLIESFIVHLFSSGALELKKILDNDLESWKNEDLQFPDTALLHPQALCIKDQAKLDQLIQSNSVSELTVGIVIDKKELETNINVQNIDALIMIQIDTLTPYQQLLLKIASVIGNVFSRDLLENIMYGNNVVTTAKAIKRLFAMRILICANVRHGYSDRVKSGIFSSKSSINAMLACSCSFDYNPEDHHNLPKYAFCKIMKFRSINSRKTCYELLPMNQKKEFHSRIVYYLESNRQKCTECGGTIMVIQSIVNDNLDPNPFEDLKISNKSFSGESGTDSSISLETELQNEKNSIHHFSFTNNNISMRKVKSECENIERSNLYRNNSKGSSPNSSSVSNNRSETNYFSNSILKTKYNDDDTLNRRSIKRVTMQSLLQSESFIQPREKNDTVNKKIFDMLRPVTEAEHVSDWRALGLYDSDENISDDKKYKSRNSFTVNIENGVSKTDFNKCTCSDLNIVIFEQLIYHSKQAELKNKTIEFQIKFGYWSILESNFENALPKLNEAEKCCLERQQNDIITPFEKRRYLGRIYTLRATAYLLAGQMVSAKIDIERAMKIYQINLDKVSEFFKIRSIVASIKIKRRKFRIKEELMNSDSVLCLNIATILYSSIGEQKFARKSALRAVELIQKVNCEVIDVLESLTNAIQVDLDRGASESTAEIEHVAMNMLRRMSRPVKAQELCTLGKFFLATFHARLARAQISQAIHSGFRSLVISRVLQADSISLEIIPDLFYALLSRRLIPEAIDLAQEILRLGQRRIGLDCETWYYALCMDLILDAGLQLEPPHEINRFAEYSVGQVKTKDQGARRLVVNLWTYWLRADSERRAKRFETQALSWAREESDDGSLTVLLHGLRLAEGMLESLARKVNDLRKVVDVMELRSLADRELSRLENDARICRTVYPRWLLLKATSSYLSGRQAQAKNGFAQALEEARKTKNRLEEAGAIAATIDSSIWIQSARAGVFIGWQEGIEHVQSSWHQLLYKIKTTR